jgi:CHAT domain-containing protein
MEKFYQILANRDDRFTALSKAQRAMPATTDKALNAPSSWAGYIPFGKP